MTAIAVAKVNLEALPADEAAAIRAAEAEAEAFHGAIEAEELERHRLAELKKVCGLMWNSRSNAVAIAEDYLFANNTFAPAEAEAIVRVAEGLHPEAETRTAIKSLNFINAVSLTYRTMQTGYYFNNLPATQLLRKA